MPPLYTAKGVFTTSADGALQECRVGFEPAAVMAWWTRQGEDGVGPGNRGGLGFWAADGTCAALAWASDDGVAPTSTASITDGAALLGLDSSQSGVSMRAELDSVTATGFVLGWTVPPTASWTVHYLVFGGPSLTRARVGWLLSPTSPGREIVRLEDMSPDLVLFAPTGLERRASTSERLSIALGAATRKGQAVAGFTSRNGAEAGDVGGAQRNDAALISVASRSELMLLAKVGLRHEALAIDWARVGPVPVQIPYLALEGVQAKVGTHVSPTQPGARATRGVGFRAQALLLLTWGLRPSPDPTDIGRLCVGGATSPQSCGCAGWDDRDTDARPANTHVCSSSTDAVIVTNTQTGGIHAAASLHSIDPDGFTLAWHASDGFLREVTYVAMAGIERWSPARAARRRWSRPTARLARWRRRSI